jgi:membrane-bound metal-dependent hydrolase YbcI (DUF457 family)
VSNHREHVRAGAVAGGATAAFLARNQPGHFAIAEIFAGSIGGVLGAKLPDVLEPAIHSWHRSSAHSISAAGGIALVAVRKLQDWQEYCRKNTAKHSAQLAMATEPLARMWHSLLILVWSLLAGFAPGVVAGYLSHLAMDACTPRGIPVFCRGS